MNGKKKKTQWYMVAVLWLLLLLSLLPSLTQSYPLWKDLDGNYFHQPFLLLYIIYCVVKEKEIVYKFLGSSRVDNGFYSGLLVLLSSYFYLITVVSNSPSLFSLSIPLFIGSVIMFLLGWNFFKKILFYIMMLAFSFPYPVVVMTMFKWGLRNGTLLLSTVLLKLIDTATLRMGDLIHSMGESVRVGFSCSGINSLIILIPLLAVAARLVKPSTKRLLTVVVLVPLSVIFFNSFRVISMFLFSPFIDFNLAVEHFHNIGPVFFLLNAWFVLTFLRYRSGKTAL